MLTLFQKAYDWLAGVQSLPMNQGFAFKVMLGPLVIGTLRADHTQWVFAYSDEFRNQSEIQPIVDFPSVNQEYRTRILWPFFALRIPSPAQPAVREFIRSLPEAKADEAILLKEFGARCAANPFRLVPE
jgi:HipA-like protein